MQRSQAGAGPVSANVTTPTSTDILKPELINDAKVNLWDFIVSQKDQSIKASMMTENGKESTVVDRVFKTKGP
jgi:hypothetical protein